MRWELFIVAAFFGVLAYATCRFGAFACEKIVPFADGPARGTPPVLVLVSGSAIIGGAACYRDASPSALVITALLVCALVASWVSDETCGIIPDTFTLLPLAALTALRMVLGEWEFPVAGLLVFMPFAFTALLSRGRGMGWGDVKLATLGGVALGAGTALPSFIAASLVAVAIACARGKMREPIAFGPYLAGALGVASAMTGVVG